MPHTTPSYVLHTSHAGAADKEVFRRHASRAPLTVQQLDHVVKQLAA